MIKKFLYLIAIILLTIVFCICAQEEKKVIPLTTNSKKALEYYEKALRELDRVQRADVAKYFKKAVEADPEFVMALAFYANRLDSPENQQMIDEAKKFFHKVTEGEQKFTLAVEAKINNNLEKCKEILEELAAKYPDDGRVVYFNLTYIYMLLNMHDKAIEAGEKAIACNPNIYGTYNILGYSYMAVGKFDEAIESLKKYAKLMPDSANPLDSLGDAYRQAGRYKEAWESYQKAHKIKPDFFAPLIHLGDVRHELGFYEEAVPYYLEALKTLLPTREISESYYRGIDSRLRVKLLNNYLYLGEIEKADKMVTEEFFYAEEIDTLKSQEEEEVDKILQHDSKLGNIFGHYVSAEIALKEGEVERAKKETELVQQLEKKYSFFEEEKDQIVNFLRAKIALAENDLVSSEKFALAAVNAFLEVGRSYMLNYIYSLGDFRRICVEPINLLAEIKRKQSKIDDEIQVIKKSIELIPHQPKLHYRLGEIYAQQNKKEKATESFRKYLVFCEYFNCSEEAKEKAKQFIAKY